MRNLVAETDGPVSSMGRVGHFVKCWEYRNCFRSQLQI